MILFSMLQYTPEKLSKLWHGHSCFAFCKKVLGFIFFLILFSCSTYLFKFTKFTGKYLCQSFYFNKVTGQTWNFIKIQILAHAFCCEFSKICKNTFYRMRLGDCFYKRTQDAYILFVFLYFQLACNCSNSSKQDVKYSFYNLSIKGEK